MKFEVSAEERIAFVKASVKVLEDAIPLFSGEVTEEDIPEWLLVNEEILPMFLMFRAAKAQDAASSRKAIG